MLKYSLLVIAFLLSFSISAQRELQKELDSVTTIKKAQRFIDSKNGRKNKIITFNEEKHKTKLTEELLKLSNGGHKVIKREGENIHYKILEKNEITYYRVSYILLDGKELSISSIESLRPQIIEKHKRGVSFKDLALQYSMDKNRKRGGDSGWFTYGDMLPEFEQQVMNDTHQKDDIFTVNVESNQWYYVVKKTHDKKSIKEIKVLKVVESTR
ncbi:MAG: peptidylprolyl isomerase [Flavobacteriaceae bacterium]|nr:peptidylprolyl isomerase [Flavobacteriaceae bacterium]